MKLFKKIATHDHSRTQIFKMQYYFVHLILRFFKMQIRNRIFNRDKLEKKAQLRREKHYIKHPELYNGNSIKK